MNEISRTSLPHVFLHHLCVRTAVCVGVWRGHRVATCCAVSMIAMSSGSEIKQTCTACFSMLCYGACQYMAGTHGAT